jgi:hypothetical protein
LEVYLRYVVTTDVLHRYLWIMSRIDKDDGLKRFVNICLTILVLIFVFYIWIAYNQKIENKSYYEAVATEWQNVEGEPVSVFGFILGTNAKGAIAKRVISNKTIPLINEKKDYIPVSYYFLQNQKQNCVIYENSRRDLYSSVEQPSDSVKALYNSMTNDDCFRVSNLKGSVYPTDSIRNMKLYVNEIGEIIEIRLSFVDKAEKDLFVSSLIGNFQLNTLPSRWSEWFKETTSKQYDKCIKANNGMLVYLNYSENDLEADLSLEKGSLDIKRQADGKTYQLVKSRGWSETYTYTEYLKKLAFNPETSSIQPQDKYENAFE